MKIIAFFCFLVVPQLIRAEEIYTNEFEQNSAIRASQFNLVDPHVYVELFGFLCTDVTSQLNDQVQSSLTTDSDMDGYIDTNLITQFSSDQPAYITTRTLQTTAINGQCPDPLHSEACETLIAAKQTTATNTNSEGQCLSTIENSTSGYNPTPNKVIAPCFATEPVTSSIDLGGVEVSLQSFQQGSRYPGELILDNGLSMGFISEVDAQMVVFPVDTPVVGGQTLASLLAGGTGNCSANDDRDTYTDGKTMGWWFYFNTESELIELIEVQSN